MSAHIETRAEPPVLRTTELTHRFGSLVAVDALDLAIAPRLIFGLLGSNGAGKTTTIRMLTTLLPPTSGTAEVAGYDIVREPDRVRQRIGYGRVHRAFARDPRGRIQEDGPRSDGLVHARRAAAPLAPRIPAGVRANPRDSDWLADLRRVHGAGRSGALRTLMVHGGTSAVGLAADFGVLSLVFLGLLLLAARLLPGIVR
jgi:hypothetical protein